jgi:hypothetical protein
MLERRQAPPQRSFLRGLVYFNNRQSAVDCLIRDISDLGARLKFPDSVVLPDAIELYIPQRTRRFPPPFGAGPAQRSASHSTNRDALRVSLTRSIPLT